MPAAGLGTRMAPLAAPGKKSAPSKQFTELAGTPILIHTLRKFAAVPRVDEIWVALRQGEIAGFRARLEKETNVLQKRVELVVGGEQRQQSVANALNAIAASPDDIVLIHD